MIDLQNHIRNEGLLNLFDGRGTVQQKHRWSPYEVCETCGITAEKMIEHGPAFCSGPLKALRKEIDLARTILVSNACQD